MPLKDPPRGGGRERTVENHMLAHLIQANNWTVEQNQFSRENPVMDDLSFPEDMLLVSLTQWLVGRMLEAEGQTDDVPCSLEIMVLQ